MISLYPSLQAEQSAAIVVTLAVRESNLKVEGIHWEEAVLYLALTMAKEKVDEMKLQEVIPAWKKAGGRRRRPGITTNEVKGKDERGSIFLLRGGVGRGRRYFFRGRAAIKIHGPG